MDWVRKDIQVEILMLEIFLKIDQMVKVNIIIEMETHIKGCFLMV